MTNNKPNFNVVLFEPEIPQNTGNIIRLCVCSGCDLYLVGKLGFVLSDKYLKRAGMDYIKDINIFRYNNLETLMREKSGNFYFLTTKSKTKYTEKNFNKGDFFVFGPESRGLDEKLLFSNPDKSITIPMELNQRSLNLSNSVAIVIYEAIRQTNLL